MYPGLVKDPRESVSDGEIKLWRWLGKLSSACKADQSVLLIDPCDSLLCAAAFHGAPEDVGKQRKAFWAIFKFFFCLVLISFNIHCLELILTSFSLFSILASSSCTSCLFTLKEADWLWHPLKCRSQLKMLSAGGCPDGWAGSQKGNLRHPAAIQGQLKDCSHSSSGFTNDANRCVVSP